MRKLLRCRPAWGLALLMLLLFVSGNAMADMVSGDWAYTLNADGKAVVTRYLGSQREVELFWKLDNYMVVEIGEEAFAGNTAIRSVKLPVGVRVIRMNAFMDCTALEEIALPSRLETIEDGAFIGCTALKKLEIPESVAEIGEGCFEATTILTGNQDSIAGSYAQAMGMDYQKTNNMKNSTFHRDEDDYQYEIRDGGAVITSYVGKEYEVVIPSELAGYPVRAIGSNAFSSRYEVESVVLPEGLIELENNAFRFCKGLMSIQFPSTLQSIGDYAFFQCENLVEIVLPEGLTTLGNRAFERCKRLREVTIYANVKKISNYTFFECHDKLTIYGISKSEAESFASRKEYKFVSIGK